MATLDTTGRCLRPALGKGKVPTAIGAQVQLHFSECGVVPKLDLTPESLRDKGIRKFPERANAVQPEDTKAYHRKHPIAAAQTANADVHIPRGKKKVAVSVAETQASSSAVTTNAGGSGDVSSAAARSLLPKKSPRNRLMTAEQNAIRRLEKLAAADDSLKPAVSQAVAVGGDVAVELERRIRKQLTIQQAQQEIHAKHRDDTERPKSADLGRTTVSAPFATSGGQGHQQNIRSTRRVFSQKFAMGVEDAFTVKANRRPQSSQGVPFDTTHSDMYPEPPLVGTSTSRSSLHQGKHRVELRQSTETADEELMRKAKARCPVSAAQTMPDFLFGHPPPASERRVRLAERQEQHVKSVEEFSTNRTRGKVYCSQKNASTSLW